MDRRRIAALLGAGILAAACGTTTPASPTAPPATPGRTPSVTASPRPMATPIPTPNPSPTPRALRPGEDDWGRVPFANGLRDRYGSTAINAMAEAGGRIVAVGTGPAGAAAWVSTDGLNWRRAQDDPSFRGAEMSDVAALGSTLVAVGMVARANPAYDPDDSESDEPESLPEAAAWTSADGLRWRQSEIEQAEGAWIDGVAVANGVLLAVGHRAAGDPWEDTDDLPAGWMSRDGANWRQVPALSEARCGTLGAGAPGFVFICPDFVAVSRDGAEWRPGTFPSPLVDAYAWEDGSLGGIVSDIAWTGDHFIAVGGLADHEGHKASAWTSPDGTTWTALDVLPGVGAHGRPRFLSVVATADGRLLACSDVWDESSGGFWSPELWISDDGAAWSSVPTINATNPNFGPAPPYVWPALEFEGRLIAFGSAPDGTPGDGKFVGSYGDGSVTSAAVWTNPSPGLAEPSPGPAVCPGARPVLIEVIDLSPKDRLRCFGRRSITLRAYVTHWEIEYGFWEEKYGKPTWLTAGQVGSGLARARPLASESAVGLELAVDPASSIAARLPRGGWVWLTGRFDHPKAKTCPAKARSHCRQAFVVTNVRKADAP